jgi:hypothetical protein
MENGTVSLTLVGYGMSVTSSTGLHVSLTCNLPSTCCLPFDLTYTHVHHLDFHTSLHTHVIIRITHDTLFAVISRRWLDSLPAKASRARVKPTEI